MTKFTEEEREFISAELEGIETVRKQFEERPSAPDDAPTIKKLIARCDACIKAFKHALES